MADDGQTHLRTDGLGKAIVLFCFMIQGLNQATVEILDKGDTLTNLTFSFFCGYGLFPAICH